MNVFLHGEADLTRQVDYIHYNPVKHGWVKRPVDWPHSTLHGYIDRGMLPADWGEQMGDEVGGYGERLNIGLHFIQPNLRRLMPW